LIRLDGGAPAVIANASGTNYSSAVAGDTILYSNEPNVAANATFLGSKTAGALAPETSTTPAGILISAYGEAVLAHNGGTIATASDAHHVSVLLRPGPAAAVVNLQAATPGHVFWTSDQVNPAHPHDNATVFTRGVNVTGDRIRLGRERVVGRLPTGDAVLDPAFHLQTGQRSVAWGDVYRKTVTARSPYGRFRRTGRLVGVSNRWLLTSRTGAKLNILDMKHRTTSTIGFHPTNGPRHDKYDLPPFGFDDDLFAMSARRLALIDRKGLQVIDLATHRRRTVVPFDRSRNLGDLAIAGRELGWDDLHDNAHIRNLRTGHTEVFENRFLSRMTARCAVFDAFRRHSRVDVYLANFNGDERRVLAGVDRRADNAVLQGRVLSWVSRDGQLDAKVVRLP
jgi:hypothetical protein